jgi:hypothetical protein
MDDAAMDLVFDPYVNEILRQHSRDDQTGVYPLNPCTNLVR